MTKNTLKKEVLIELGVPLQRIDVEGMEVWKYYFSRGYTHVKETKFADAESYEKRETINLFFGRNIAHPKKTIIYY